MCIRDSLYNNPVAKSEEKKAKAMLKQLYFYYMEHIEAVSYTHLDVYKRQCISWHLMWRK